MKSSHSEKMSEYIEDYQSGIYSTNEIIGIIIDFLSNSSDSKILWNEVPDWGKILIHEFLKECNESTIIYNFSLKSSAPISSNLLNLKNWLDSK